VWCRWAEEHIKRVLVRNIEESTWLEPTPIQMQAIPVMTAGRVCTTLGA
jgi:superfamily II DNA/RNA helicase